MRKLLLRLAGVCLLSAAAVWAQAVSGTLSGKVTSAAGAVIPNAAVTITNVNTNASQKVLTGPDGSFSIAGLAPGTYRVDVETAGYKRTSQQNVELTSTGPSAVNITLEAGNINETVEIKASAPAVQDRSGEVSMGLTTRPVRELPVIDRNYQQLVGLETGITPPQPIYDPLRDPQRNRFFSANGQSPLINQWMAGGVVNQEPFRGTAIRVQPEESLQELHIVTSNYREEKGFSGGAINDTMMRGGTNGWHGSLFEFHNDNDLNSRAFFNAASNPIPRYVYNQFGAAVGGAIVPDKTFFFGSYEGNYTRGDQTQVNTVPTTQALSGNFSGIPGLQLYYPNTGINGFGRTPISGNLIPASQINTTAAAIARYFPAPNQPGFFNNYVSNVPFQRDYQKFDGRLDQHFSDRTSAFLRYGYSNTLAHQGSPLGDVVGFVAGDRVVGQNAVADVAHEFGPRLITDFRFGYNRYQQRMQSMGDQTALANTLGPSLFGNGLMGISIPGLPALGAAPDVPMYGVDNTFDGVWNWSLHTSMNNLKWGVDIRRIRSDGFINPMFGPNGTTFFGPGVTMAANGPALSANGALYNSLAGFLLGSPSQIGVSNFLTTPTIRQTESSLWLGDTIQLMHRVTADLGVRYEVNTSNNTFNFAGINGGNMHTTMYDLDNIAPRAGLAFRLTNRTVIRGGYGWSYFQVPYLYSGFTAPMFGAVAGVQGGFGVAPFTGPFGASVVSTTAAPGSLQNGAAAGNLPAAVIPHHLDTPYVQSFSLQVQQDFYAGTLLSVGYVGTQGRHLPGIYELNAAMPGAGVAGLPFSNLGRTASTLFYDQNLTNNYNSLQASLTKRFSKGLSFIASYSYAKALGYTTGNDMVLNPFNLRANYGPLDYDRQQVLSISHLWELPGRKGGNIVSTLLGGWQLNGIFTWQTGTPLTITADPIACACPGNTVLASLSGPANFGPGTTYLTPAGFSAPPSGQFGNLGRGALRGPDTWNYNASLFKSFRVKDRFNLELRGEAYNIFNTVQYANPMTNISSPAFGQVTNTLTGSFDRQLNVGARILF
ncbi:MAG: TonB-dependent receptor [Acidobacteriia bacterium]|nr:TonB-dependent receptor [Terriglobia bacterium]